MGFRGTKLTSLTGITSVAGWSSLVARRAHNPKVRGSNPLPATNFNCPILLDSRRSFGPPLTRHPIEIANDPAERGPTLGPPARFGSSPLAPRVLRFYGSTHSMVELRPNLNTFKDLAIEVCSFQTF